MGVCQCKEDMQIENQILTSRCSSNGNGSEIEEMTFTRETLLPPEALAQNQHQEICNSDKNINPSLEKVENFMTENLLNGNDFVKQTMDKSYYIGLESESESDYEDDCKKLFNIFTDLRKNTLSYINMCPSNLRPLVEGLNKNTPSVLCWSQSLFENLFDFLKMASDRKISDEFIIITSLKFIKIFIRGKVINFC
jgi:hypothetical protein